jgi:hypothetical protein
MKQLALSSAVEPSTYKTTGAFAAGGAMVGSVIPGIGTVVGAVAGGLIGLGVSLMDNIKAQKTDTLAAQRIVLTDGQRNLNQLALLVQVDRNNSEKYIEAWNEQNNKMIKAWSQLKADTRTNLNLMVNKDGAKELQRFEDYFNGGGYALAKQKMQNAIIAPNDAMAAQELMLSQQTIGGENGQ